MIQGSCIFFWNSFINFIFNGFALHCRAYSADLTFNNPLLFDLNCEVKGAPTFRACA